MAENVSFTPEGTLAEGTLRQLEQRNAVTDPLRALRERALRELRSAAFPTASSEFWRYTTPDLIPFGRLGDAQPAEHQIGQLGSASTLPAGVRFERLGGSGGSARDVLEILQRRTESSEQNTVRALQCAAITDAHVLSIAPGATIEAPIHLVTRASSSSAPLTVVLVERGATATLLLDDHAADGELFSPCLEIVLRAGASLSFASLQRGGANSSILACHRYHLARDSRLRGFYVPVGGRVSRLDADIFLHEAGSDAEFISVLHADRDRHIGLFPTQHHLAPHCVSNVSARSVLSGQGRTVYYGYIRVAEGAQKTDAYQSSKNLVISPTARADAIPNLRIQANDVKCSHGASVGQLGLEELFYLLSRGLRRDEAERLLVEGFMGDLYGKIQHKAVREYVQAAGLGAFTKR